MISLLLLAGGTGTRMGTGVPKQYLSLKGKPLALYSLEVLSSFPEITETIVVCAPIYHHLFPHARYAEPGKRRQDSVFNALQMATSPFVLIHDAARPFVDPACVKELILVAKEIGAAVLAVPVKSTIKEGMIGHDVKKTLDRTQLVEIQTPQMIRRDWLLEGYARLGHETVTDDVSIIEKMGHPVRLVLGSYRNLKVTTPEDLLLAEALS